MFAAYHAAKVEEQNVKLEAKRRALNKRLQAQRKALQDTINTVVARIKQRDMADPCFPNAATLSQLLKWIKVVSENRTVV